MSGTAGQVYLVTGGCGFLGKHLVRMLAENGEGISEIRAFDLRPDREIETLSTDAVRVKFIEGDITDYSNVREAVRGVDVVINSAALVDIWGKNPPSKIWAVNYHGTCNVLEACKELGVQYLLHTSTMEVVGPNMKGDHFIRGNEETEYNVQNTGPYAQSKAEAEKLVLQANGEKVKVEGQKTLVTCALRPTGIYGEHNALMANLYRELVSCGRRRLRLAKKEVEHARVYVGNVAWMHLLAARALQRTPDILGGQAYFCYDDSPYLSYEDFDMELLGPCGIRMLGQRPPLPFCALYLLALLAEVLCWLLRPLVNFNPALNRHTLRIVTTAFTVRTDKAARHFGYRPLVPWTESKARTTNWAQSLDAEMSKKQ
ncbi:3 beta-hydroxysteroid dehydrogenase type 7 isoform X2 [Heterodontus francisci]|uniref:3 beta-hydroxysteroid dehydrogenase type 7 isoform X2 n=1 Tax=Heterodontus francisci TaxID=7792 RepID=UPI00355B8B2F